MAAKQTGAVDKATEQETPKAAKLNPAQEYTLVGTGKNRHLKKGDEYPVSGADAQALIESGAATLKKD